MLAIPDRPLANWLYVTVVLDPAWPSGTRSPPAGTVPPGSCDMIYGDELADSVPLESERFVPTLIWAGPHVADVGFPSNVPLATDICGWTPTSICARVTFRVMPAWLTRISSVSDAAVAGGN